MKTQGWESFPVLSSITRVLERFEFRHCIELNEVQKKVRQKVWDKKRYGRINMDFDSSAKSAYGHQEGVARGHNTERSHKPMLNPTVCVHCSDWGMPQRLAQTWQHV